MESTLTVPSTGADLAGEAPGDFQALPTRQLALVAPTPPTVEGTTCEGGELREEAPSVVPAPLPDSVEAIIARLDARQAEIIAHSASVLTYERKRPPVSMVGRDSRSERPMCAGCGYGIRKETRQVEGPRGVYHPNCAKVAVGAADASKISPRYLAAIVPLTQIRLQQLALPTPEPVAEVNLPVETSEPEVLITPEGEAPSVEDQTTDLVEKAVQETGKGKRGKGKRQSA